MEFSDWRKIEIGTSITIQITAVGGRSKAVALLDEGRHRCALWMPPNHELGTVLQLMLYSALGTYRRDLAFRVKSEARP